MGQEPGRELQPTKWYNIQHLGAAVSLILGNGCSIPPSIKPGNFRTMIETGKNYELSKAG